MSSPLDVKLSYDSEIVVVCVVLSIIAMIISNLAVYYRRRAVIVNFVGLLLILGAAAEYGKNDVAIKLMLTAAFTAAWSGLVEGCDKGMYTVSSIVFYVSVAGALYLM